MTMLLIGMWLEAWGSTVQGSDSISEGPCRLKYMTIRILRRMNEYRLWLWGGMTHFDNMNLMRMNNAILFPSPRP